MSLILVAVLHSLPRSAAQPASPDDYIPTALRGTPLGSTLLERMASERWHPIILDDVPRKWLPVLQRRPPKFEDGRLNGSTMCGTIALTMPNEPVCRMYKQWFEMLPPTAKLDVATFMEAHSPLLRLMDWKHITACSSTLLCMVSLKQYS